MSPIVLRVPPDVGVSLTRLLIGDAKSSPSSSSSSSSLSSSVLPSLSRQVAVSVDYASKTLRIDKAKLSLPFDLAKLPCVVDVATRVDTSWKKIGGLSQAFVVPPAAAASNDKRSTSDEMVCADGLSPATKGIRAVHRPPGTPTNGELRRAMQCVRAIQKGQTKLAPTFELVDLCYYHPLAAPPTTPMAVPVPAVPAVPAAPVSVSVPLVPGAPLVPLAPLAPLPRPIDDVLDQLVQDQEEVEVEASGSVPLRVSAVSADVSANVSAGPAAPRVEVAEPVVATPPAVARVSLPDATVVRLAQLRAQINTNQAYYESCKSSANKIMRMRAQSALAQNVSLQKEILDLTGPG